jgi:acyl-CoA synthetase (AMP-forming)/AMP-acid ligase II
MKTAPTLDPTLLGGNLVDVLRARAELTPDREPHHFGADGQSWRVSLSYAALDQAARTIAVRLKELAEPGDRVLLLYGPGLDFTMGFWGCLYAGMIAVPLAPPRLSKLQSSLERMLAIRSNSGADLLLTTTEFLGKLGGLSQVDGFTDLRLVATDELDPATASTWTPPAVDGESIAYLQYSSGSTGTPKGVILPHRSVLANAAVIGRAANLSSADIGVSWLPTFHDMGLLSAVVLPIVHDATVYQMSPLSFVQRPMDWLRAISAVGATTTVAPNFAYELCARRALPKQIEELDLSTLTVTLCGAEPIRSAALQAFADRFAEAKFSPSAFFPCYGLAEATLMVTGGPYLSGVTTTTVQASALALGHAEPVPAGSTGRELVASGAPRPELPLLIADPDTLEPLPDECVGEILVTGESLGVGYWNQPTATADSFGVKLPGRQEEYLRTGDLGFLHDGQLYVTGRRKDLIIIDGANHYPQDIEAVAADAHRAVRVGGGAAFQLIEPGTSELILVLELDRAFQLVDDLAAGEAAANVVSLSEVESAVRQAISAEFALRLNDVVLVRQGSLPLTTSGKLQRFATAQMYRNGQLTVASPMATS